MPVQQCLGTLQLRGRGDVASQTSFRFGRENRARVARPQHEEFGTLAAVVLLGAGQFRPQQQGLGGHVPAGGRGGTGGKRRQGGGGPWEVSQPPQDARHAKLGFPGHQRIGWNHGQQPPRGGQVPQFLPRQCCVQRTAVRKGRQLAGQLLHGGRQRQAGRQPESGQRPQVQHLRGFLKRAEEAQGRGRLARLQRHRRLPLRAGWQHRQQLGQGGEEGPRSLNRRKGWIVQFDDCGGRGRPHRPERQRP